MEPRDDLAYGRPGATSWLLLAWFWNVDMCWDEVVSYFCLRMEPSLDKCRGPQTTKHDD